MFRSTSLIGSGLVVMLGASIIGCGRGGTVAELTEEAVAEAVANQAISAYYEVGLSVTTENGVTVGLQCDHGGELNWTALDDTGEVYAAVANDCIVSGNYGTITINGEYTVSGFPATVGDDGSIEDLDGKTIYVEGDVTATNEDGNSKSCSYDLDVTQIQVESSGSSVTISTEITGQICNSRDFSVGTSFTISGQVEVDEATQE